MAGDRRRSQLQVVRGGGSSSRVMAPSTQLTAGQVGSSSSYTTSRRFPRSPSGLFPAQGLRESAAKRWADCGRDRQWQAMAGRWEEDDRGWGATHSAGFGDWDAKDMR